MDAATFNIRASAIMKFGSAAELCSAPGTGIEALVQLEGDVQFAKFERQVTSY